MIISWNIINQLVFKTVRSRNNFIICHMNWMACLWRPSHGSCSCSLAVTTEARVPPCASPCGVCSGRSGTVTGISPSSPIFAASIILPLFHIHHDHVVGRISGRILGTAHQINALQFLRALKGKLRVLRFFLSCVVWDFGLPGCSAVSLASKL